MIQFTFEKAKEHSKEPIKLGDRVFGYFIIVLSLVMLYALNTHRIEDTGFFKRELKVFEWVLLYGYWVAWIITASLDSVFNKRLASRLFDSFGGILFLGISSLYFLIEFPFDFSEFSEAFRFSVWIYTDLLTDNAAKVLLLLNSIAMLIAQVYSPFNYKLFIFSSNSVKTNHE